MLPDWWYWKRVSVEVSPLEELEVERKVLLLYIVSYTVDLICMEDLVDIGRGGLEVKIDR